MPSFLRIDINTMTNLYHVVELASECGEQWIFRGQENATWKLCSSLERQMIQYGIIGKDEDIFLSQENRIRIAEKDMLEIAKQTGIDSNHAEQIIEEVKEAFK